MDPAAPPLPNWTTIYEPLGHRFRDWNRRIVGMDGGYAPCPVDKGKFLAHRDDRRGYFEPNRRRQGQMPYI